MQLVVLGLVLAGAFTWESNERSTFAQLALNSDVLALAAGVRFTEYRAELNIVAEDILDGQALRNPPRARVLLKNSLNAIPQATTIDLARDGHLIATVGDTSTLPALPGDFFMAVAPEEARLRGEFSIGRLIHGSAPNRWIVPIRYTRSDGHGRRFSLTMFIDPARILVDWRGALSDSKPASNGLSFRMVRSDGYLLASWPLPRHSRARGYDEPVPWSGHQHGHYVGVAEPYAGLRMISFTHVGGANIGEYPAFAEASVLRSATIAGWWREFVPILLVGMLVLIGLYYGIELLRDAEQRFDVLQSRREEELLQEARVDSVTRLPNRVAFMEHVDEALARADRGGSGFAVGVLDLDDFKLVNDHWGHATGDIVLTAVGQQLRAGLRTNDYVARLSGDEFALLLDNIDSESELEAPLRRLEQHLAAPMTLTSGVSADIRCSLGVTMYPHDLSDRDGLLRHADYAMYQAKAEKNDRTSFWRTYDGTLRKDRAEAREKWSALLAGGALRVHYQPVVDARSGNVIAVEALARLAQGEYIHPPIAFLADFDLADLRLLTESVLNTALRDVKAWDNAGHRLDIAVNVDPYLLMEESFVSFVKELLELSGIDPRRVTLEILETHKFDSIEGMQSQLTRLSKLGVRLSLDDIGAEYSSLMRLKQLPIDEIKLDREFISNLLHTPGDLVYTMALQCLAANLGIRLVAEGVETGAVADAMSVLGVDRLQGFFISRPLCAPDLLNWLQADHRLMVHDRPQTLLGAYAAHLCGHERIRRSWKEISRHTLADFQSCRMGRFLATNGSSYAPVIESHRAYHRAAAVALRPDDPALERTRLLLASTVRSLLLVSLCA